MERSPAPVYTGIETLVADLDRDAVGRIVLANGCFDPLHVGHIRYLDGAHEHGDYLVVALNDDAGTRALKGKDRPVVAETDRAVLLAALSSVDAVVLFGAASVAAILERLRPDVHAKGTDYTVDSVPELETSKELGIETVIVGDPKSHASSDVVDTIRRRGRR